jgi:Arc/MetJ-type ribon-helix-helix transcriptional regulator
VDTSSDPGLYAERSEALKLAVLRLLEKLNDQTLFVCQGGQFITCFILTLR